MNLEWKWLSLLSKSVPFPIPKKTPKEPALPEGICLTHSGLCTKDCT